MAEERIAEEPAGVALHQRDGGRVDGCHERNDPHAAQYPVGRDRQHEPHGGIGAGGRRDEEQCGAKRGMLKQIGHPAMERGDAATDQNGPEQWNNGLQGVDLAPSSVSTQTQPMTISKMNSAMWMT